MKLMPLEFHRIVREERLFCAVLAHLLMQGEGNLRTFVDLVAQRSSRKAKSKAIKFADAQVYVEFTFLRDSWNSLGKDNETKRAEIFRLLRRVDGLTHLRSEDFPEAIADFNEIFVGPSGRRITTDIVYPGRWTVSALAERFGGNLEEFQNVCRFKWSFNIKPDLVVLVPGLKPICVEAKLASVEGKYPSSSRDRKIFDRVFGPEEGRVAQLELQRFMFERLLETPCRFVTVGLKAPGDEAVALSWREVFDALDLSNSLPYVRRLVEENVHLR